RFWSLRAPAGTAFAPLLPGTGAELMIHRGAASHLVCLRNAAWQPASSSALDVFCIRFRAGAIRHFVDANVADVVDANAAFDVLAGQLARELRERITDARDFDTAVLAAERVLLALRRRFARPDALVDRAVRRLYAESGALRIEALARDLGVGRRHL